jgi:predicted RNase H-like HicB family nuclease
MAYRGVVQKFEVVFEPEEGGGYHVSCPALKGCHSFGRTKQEARDKIAEAIELWLETAAELDLPIPEREIVEVGGG